MTASPTPADGPTADLDPPAEDAALWRATLDALTKQVAVLDGTGRIVAVNEAWRKFATGRAVEHGGLGVGADYVAACEGTGDPHAIQVARGTRDVLAGRSDAFRLEAPLIESTERRWLAIQVSAFDVDGLRRVVVHHHDITARHVAEQRSAAQARVLDIVGVAVMVMDTDGRMTYWNRASETLYGLAADEVIGRRLLELGIVDDVALDVEQITRTIVREGSWKGTTEGIARSGHRFPARVTDTALRDDDGHLEGVIRTVTDITELKQHEREVQASRDYLDTITESVADGLLVFDTAGTVTFANAAARDMLAEGAELVGAPAGRVLYGDRPTPSTPQLLATDADGARAEDDVFTTVTGRRVPVAWTASSLARAPEAVEGTGPGGRVVVFRDVTSRRERECRLRREADGLRWAKRIRAALDEGRFVLYGQPIVDIATGAVVDHELLIRMRDTDGAMVPPGEFLPAAEEHQLMGDIDAWVTEQAVCYAAAGRNVHFNLSSQSLGDLALVTTLRRALERTGADPGLLTIELTETALVGDSDFAAAFVRHVKRVGCHVALDDFGSGYNGFVRIKELPVDILKIDQQFVRDVLTNAASESVVRAVVALAHDLGMRAVGEGIEDASTLSRLARLGVEFAQGFHLGRPAQMT